MRFFLSTLLIYMCNVTCTFSQLPQDESRMEWEDFVEMVVGENDEEIDTETMEQMLELYGNPMDINIINQEDLEIFPFLDEEQIEGIMLYLEKNGPMMSLGELMFVKELGRKEREMLRMFVKVEEKTSSGQGGIQSIKLRELLKRGNHEAVWRTDIPFYKKEGYKSVAPEVLEKSPNKVYRGDKFHHIFRYAFSSKNHLSAGIQIEKDAGERGIDYVSGYVMLKELGCVKSAVLGNYRVSFGKGLAVNSRMKFGKMMMLNTIDKMDTGLSKHSSISEHGYFTGGAATFKLNDWQLSAFVSHKKEDGTFNRDSTGISSLKTDGLHRTHLEHSKKGNLSVSNFGGNIHWEHKDLRLSATAIATHFNVPLMPRHDTPASTYRLYNASGKDFFVGSLAYAYRFKSFTFSGETAYSNTEKQNGMASLNALRWKANSSNAFTLIARYYGAKFVSINGNAFGENSKVQNEEGILMGWTSNSFRNMEIQAYVDAMYFPWLKQNVSASSFGYEGMAQVLYSPRQQWNLLARYRMKTKQKDYTYNTKGEEFKTLENNTNHHLKLQLNYNISPFVSLRTSATGTLISFGDAPNEKGFAIGENIRWQNPKNQCRFDLGITYFNTDSYNARIYHYEPSLLYSLGSTSYYYNGIRATLFASVPIIKESLFIQAKLGMTKYFNRDTIGSGLEMIDANHKEDLQIQMRWTF